MPSCSLYHVNCHPLTMVGTGPTDPLKQGPAMYRNSEKSKVRQKHGDIAVGREVAGDVLSTSMKNGQIRLYLAVGWEPVTSTVSSQERGPNTRHQINVRDKLGSPEPFFPYFPLQRWSHKKSDS